jgi:hypothetical protein
MEIEQYFQGEWEENLYLPPNHPMCAIHAWIDSEFFTKKEPN